LKLESEAGESKLRLNLRLESKNSKSGLPFLKPNPATRNSKLTAKNLKLTTEDSTGPNRA
jgi:hypothetical protein